MARVTVNLVGFKQLQTKLKDMPASLSKRIDAEIGDSVMEMEELAVRDAPVDQGILRSEISHKRESNLNWSLISQALYSAYIEFGTRTMVNIPSGLEDVAAQFKGSGGSSLDAKQAIFLWCKRQGIEERLWYPIFISIMTKGIKPHPFFFKQLNVVRPKLIARLEKILGSV